jgi:hypothetical protein
MDFTGRVFMKLVSGQRHSAWISNTEFHTLWNSKRLTCVTSSLNFVGRAWKGNVPILINNLEASGCYTYNFNTKNSAFSPQVVNHINLTINNPLPILPSPVSLLTEVHCIFCEVQTADSLPFCKSVRVSI